MQTPLRRRALTMLALTTAAAALTGIATADGPSVTAVTADLALDGIGPDAATDLTEAAPLAIRTPLVPVAPTPVPTEDTGNVATAVEQATVEARTPAAAPGADRVAVDDSWSGVASWYGPNFHGRTTANGEVFDMDAMTAAHKTLPFGTVLEVTNPRNGQTVQVRINDRGPFIEGREIDLSRAAARSLGIDGVGSVVLEVV